ncbi:hypothetical protein LLE67_15340 [Xanthomonas campestris]|uniref:hypothetical protein n=1 Tax=Xanthomonas campestris TaxID=339 RepID=UPI001CD78879|nr:hypothetical protein [Xanthomonas campestris]MCC5069198.1 hypothetical protein [Xanthomonas campestris]MEB2185356.1 hypothetical protein [Xanthomonas campestris pv. campestris]
MSEQNWLGYIGAIAGIIGAITGVAGAVFALLAFRRTGQLKSLDLRLELRRTESTLQSDIHDLLPLLERSKASRTRLASAQSMFNSGAIKNWLSQWNKDMALADELVNSSSVLEVDCYTMSQMELESRLVTVHKLQRSVSDITNKYEQFLMEDEAGLQQVHANNRLITQARMDGKI